MTVKECKEQAEQERATQPEYMKARTFSAWRKLKYGMSTKSFHRKSRARKEALRAEYTQDTGYKAPRHAVPHDWDEDELDTSVVDDIVRSIQRRNDALFAHFESVRETVRAKKQKGDIT